MKIVSVVGARPNFVKLSRIHNSISKHCEHIIIHTGQHYDYEMSDVFFRELKIPEPDTNLEIGSDYPGAQIGEMIKRLEKEYGFGPYSTSAIAKSRHPELVLVYGDTNSTFAGAFAASANHIPVAHVEAGLRSFDRRMPEERNRILTDHLSSMLFAPTKTGVRNLKDEHVAGKIVNSGDVSVEVVREAWKFSEKSSILKELGLKSKSFILFTMHRAESTDSPLHLKTMVRVFQDLGKKRRADRLKNRRVRFSPTDEAEGANKENSINFEDMKIVFPIHPRTEKFFKAYGLYDELKKTTNVVITKPLGYIDFLRLVKESYKIVTDSGGLQKEAYLLSVPCITIRKSTEWVETLAAGWNILCTFKRTEILKNVLEGPILSRSSMYMKEENQMVFGNGNTSEIIRKCIFSIHGSK